jgi:hypothetical protein
MKTLYCPKCGVRRFFVKNPENLTRLVTVSNNNEIVPVNEYETLEGFDADFIHCLGCSWIGSKKDLIKLFKQ